MNYIYENCEVVLTGRRATKQGTNLVLVEITPKDPNDGTWKKWVSEKVLFQIQES